MSKPKTPHERYNRDVAGMPVFAAEESLTIILNSESMIDAVAEDDENCAIALGCRKQLQTPYVSVGRSRTDLAMPHPEGVLKPGYGKTKWAVIRFGNSESARQIVIAADTKSLNEEGVVVKLLPHRPSLRPDVRRSRNMVSRIPKGIKDGRGKVKDKTHGSDELTLMGVRTLTGQRRR